MNFLKKTLGVSNQKATGGGDGSSGGTSVMTKDELRQSNMRMSSEVAALQPKNDKMTELIVKLQREYNMSKSHDPLSRYNVLKNEDDKILEVNSYQDLIKTFLEDWDRNQLSRVVGRGGGGAVGLVERARQMAKTQESTTERKEKYRGLSHAELIDEHESLKKEIHRMKDFVDKIPKAVETLKNEYESSKQFDAMRRYKILKDLIKEIISLIDPA